MDKLQNSLYSLFSANIANRLYRYLFPPIRSYAYWIKKIAPDEALTLVHIGSHDGKTGDPFYELISQHKNWKVLFVEPVSYLFQRLQTNYPISARFRFEHAAINDGSIQTFYYVKEEARQYIPSLPTGFDQLGSFDRNNLVKHLDGKLEPYIVATRIQGITLEALLNKHQIDVLDILHIDTEGHDWKILSQLDLKKYKPLLIFFEHINLSATEKAQSIQFLKSKYFIFEAGADFFCINRNIQNLSLKDLHTLNRTFPSHA